MKSTNINTGDNLMLNIARLWGQDSSLFLDTYIVCKDGQFLWNKLWLAASSSFLANALEFEDEGCLYFPDFTLDDVKSALTSLVKTDVEMFGSSTLEAFQNFVNTVRIGLEIQIESKHYLSTTNSVDKEEGAIEKFSEGVETLPKATSKKHGRPQKMKINSQEKGKNCQSKAVPHVKFKSSFKKVGRPKVHPISDRPLTEDVEREGSLWKCRHCGEAFTLKKYMADHLRNNHPEIMSLLWVCELCASVHRSKKSFDYHVETHNENTVLCDVCNKTYNNIQLLKQHQKKSHCESQSGLRFVCSQCGKPQESNYKLQKHIESVHERLRRWKCLNCSKCYLTRNNWRRHCEVRYGKYDDSMLKVLSIEEARAVPPFLMNPPNPQSKYQKKKVKKKDMEELQKVSQTLFSQQDTR